MKTLLLIATCCLLGNSLCAAGKKTEKPVDFIPAMANPVIGDWQANDGLAAQVYVGSAGKLQANLLSAFDRENNVLAVLKAAPDSVTAAPGNQIALAGDGWTAEIKAGTLAALKDGKSSVFHHIQRTPPSLGAPPPAGAVVLFDGRNLDAWAKKNGKEWLVEDGPARWKLLDAGVTEVVPGTDCIISHERFGDCRIHVEFRTLGAPSNSGVYIQGRYEANINETYGRLDQSPNAGFDNCTTDSKPKIRPCRPPLEWQTFDIDFQAPRFDANGVKTAKARATLLFNGVKIYDNQELDLPKGAGARLGEAPTGPLMLQEHGMPVQFRNIWLQEIKN